jgi:ABC-type phosphate transport system substrate-binding protein
MASMKHIIVRVLGLAGLLLPLAGQAGEIIANPSVTLTVAEVREVFLGEKQLAGGTKLVPVDNAAAQAEFASKLLQVELPKYISLWTKKSFREGLNAPAVKGSDAEVAAFVKATPGALGYVTAAPPGARVIGKY